MKADEGTSLDVRLIDAVNTTKYQYECKLNSDFVGVSVTFREKMPEYNQAKCCAVDNKLLIIEKKGKISAVTANCFFRSNGSTLHSSIHHTITASINQS